jgi:hypothetical protein
MLPVVLARAARCDLIYMSLGRRRALWYHPFQGMSIHDLLQLDSGRLAIFEVTKSGEYDLSQLASQRLKKRLSPRLRSVSLRSSGP